MSNPRLLLLDGNSLINRAFYGLHGRQNLTAPDGTPTGALFAFMNMYLRYLEDIQPTHVVVAFDRREPTIRHELYSEYKATRKPMPEDLATQIPLLKQLLAAMGVYCLEKPGYEADDIIGTLASTGSKEKIPVTIITGDKDSFQLIDDNVTVMQPVTRRGLTETEEYDPEAIRKRYNIGPEQFIDFKAIMGDPSDNIPGVKGIGEKGALELLQEYENLDQIYASLGKIRPALAKKLEESKEMAYLSRELATIICDMEISSNLQDFELQTENREQMRQLLTRLGFRNLLDRLGLTAAEPADKAESGSLRKSTIQQWQKSLADKPDYLALWLCESGFYWQEKEDEAFYLERQLLDEAWRQLKASGIRPALCDYKQLIRDYALQPLPAAAHDVLLAGHLLNQIDGRPDLARLYQHITGKTIPVFAEKELVQTDLFANSAAEAAAHPGDDTCEQAQYSLQAVWEIARHQKAEVEKRAITRLTYDVEMPLAAVLADMECRGIFVDSDVLEKLGQEMETRMIQLQADVYKLCACEFNLNSPKQLSDVLYNQLGLKPGKKRSSGSFSTDADELERLVSDHPAVPLIIEYRQLAKLRSTYIEGLKKVIDPDDGRVHTTFNQMLTATGRLSSSEPNLQNIPIRMDYGQKIRRAFTAPPGKILLDADYSQIELRLLAHLSQDKNLLTAFQNNEDIHTNTACHIFNQPAEKITPEMRGIAKTMNFSIVYGISDFGLARDLGISVKQAHRYISEYDQQYPNVRRYLKRLVKQAYADGYVETLFGRRRYISELKSNNRNVRQFGERAAMNTPVQGTAADLIKIAMVNVEKSLRHKRLQAELILQVHDELILEAPLMEKNEAAHLLQEAMQSAADLDVPLIAEVKSGSCWADCK